MVVIARQLAQKAIQLARVVGEVSEETGVATDFFAGKAESLPGTE
jgi:hypothetical protein